MQGYLSTDANAVVRVRVSGERGWITVKGRTESATRAEYEYEIPRDDAIAMMALCSQAPVSKTRYRLPVGRHEFEVDVFSGANEGLVIAEVELNSEDEAVELPAWVSEEVTEDARYYNSNLASLPFSQWHSR